MSPRPRILVVHPAALQTEDPRTGGQQRQALLVEHLREVGELEFLQPPRWKGPPAPGYYRKTDNLADADRAAALCGNLAAHRPPSDGARAFAALHPERFDLLFVIRPATVWWAGCSDPRRAILELDDVPSQTYAQQLALKRRGLRERLGDAWRSARLRRAERSLTDAFRYVLVASEDDHRYLGRANAVHVPNTYWPQPGMEAPRPASDAKAVTFVGTLFWPPNRRGLEWLVERVWPEVHRQRPDLVLRIVGHQRPHKPEDQLVPGAGVPGVELVGAVEDLGPWVQDSLCSVCPLLDGGGTRIKILESLAFGTPVVSTPHGALGLELDVADGVLRRADPAGFAAAILELAADPQRRAELARSGWERVRDRYSPAAQRDALLPLVEEILSERRASGTRSSASPSRPQPATDRTLRHALSEIAERWPEGARGDPEERPVFLLASSWRSGSTLLQRMVVGGGGALVWGEPWAHADLVRRLAESLRAFGRDFPPDTHFLAAHDAPGAEPLHTRWIANLYPDARDLLDAHRSFLRTLCAEPAKRRGYPCWGIKEVRLDVDHAAYLRLLFPGARLAFLYRDPYAAWRSYRAQGGWYERWPDEPVATPEAFGRLWQERTRGFLERGTKLDGALVRFEDLASGAATPMLTHHLDLPLHDEARATRVAGRRARPKPVPEAELAELRRAVDPLASELGYDGKPESS